MKQSHVLVCISLYLASHIPWGIRALCAALSARLVCGGRSSDSLVRGESFLFCIAFFSAMLWRAIFRLTWRVETLVLFLEQFSCRGMCIVAWMMNWRRIHSNFIYRMSNDVFWQHLCRVQYRASFFIFAAAESQFGVPWHKWTHIKTWIPYRISRIHLQEIIENYHHGEWSSWILYWFYFLK